MVTPTCSGSPDARPELPCGLADLRKATLADIPCIEKLIAVSVRGLAKADYTSDQIESALRTAFSVDSQLIADGTYFVVEKRGNLVACGGWSYRKTLCGGSHHTVRNDAIMDPSTDAAKIRAIFVHPDWSRHGLGTSILEAAEDAARTAGFRRFEMGATLTGVPLYTRKGYREIERMDVPLDSGLTLRVARMEKLAVSEPASSL